MSCEVHVPVEKEEVRPHFPTVAAARAPIKRPLRLRDASQPGDGIQDQRGGDAHRLLPDDADSMHPADLPIFVGFLGSRAVPCKKQWRAACHHCGNIRKARVLCCRCPQSFCRKCALKLVEDHGRSLFHAGCRVCKQLCCCAQRPTILRTGHCNQTHHCYKKCPTTKENFAARVRQQQQQQQHQRSLRLRQRQFQQQQQQQLASADPSTPGAETRLAPAASLTLTPSASEVDEFDDESGAEDLGPPPAKRVARESGRARDSPYSGAGAGAALPAALTAAGSSCYASMPDAPSTATSAAAAAAAYAALWPAHMAAWLAHSTPGVSPGRSLPLPTDLLALEPWMMPMPSRHGAKGLSMPDARALTRPRGGGSDTSPSLTLDRAEAELEPRPLEPSAGGISEALVDAARMELARVQAACATCALPRKLHAGAAAVTPLQAGMESPRSHPFEPLPLVSQQVPHPVAAAAAMPAAATPAVATPAAAVAAHNPSGFGAWPKSAFLDHARGRALHAQLQRFLTLQRMPKHAG
eukprot:CAMPEP_0196775446 /NCGR_PEP_ID=MMETSP1104-20130614/4032_1 /TAXON_ID=33652 /ORGANISM="Cafeteria sp., Strain Caron Lab Isolate" /LENGTH=524 /DNA_ID=CAMNT_0042145611 /DNA_START=53 /DNA_END=1624 /DNA_ORIENTATION=+